MGAGHRRFESFHTDEAMKNVYFLYSPASREFVAYAYVTDSFKDAWHLFHEEFGCVDHTIWPDSSTSYSGKMKMTIETSPGVHECFTVSEWIDEVMNGNQPPLLGRLISLSLEGIRPL